MLLGCIETKLWFRLLLQAGLRRLVGSRDGSVIVCDPDILRR
jgi:hypothetical protein